jgi:hypothetical protein
MNSREYIKHISNPGSLNAASVPELEKLVKDFPYFQSAQLLLSLAAAEWDASVYQKQIKRTAISVPNRERLYDLLQELNNKPVVETKKEEVKQTETETKKEIIVTKEIERVEEKEEKDHEAKQSSLHDKEKIQLKKVDINEQVEKEIERSLAQSIIEKEVIGVKVEEPNKPTDFSSWLSFLKNSDEDKKTLAERVNEIMQVQAEKGTKQKIERAKQKTIIDKIIESNPGQIKVKQDQKFFKSESAAKESLLDNEHLVTETLAQIYADQGNMHKAIRAYEILSLKYPQKSAYFASLILKLKNSQKD